MLPIDFFTNETLNLLESFPYQIEFCCKASEWEGKRPPLKIAVQKFLALHINQLRYRVLKQKNVPLLICKYFSVTAPIFFLKYSENSYTWNHGANFQRNDEDSVDDKGCEPVNKLLRNSEFQEVASQKSP